MHTFQIVTFVAMMMVTLAHAINIENTSALPTTRGSQVLQTNQTVSTTHQTHTKTICTKCVDPPNSTPTASVQEVVTTAIVYSTLTTCPIAKAITTNGIPVFQTTSTISTDTMTTMSTTCTKCLPLATGMSIPGAPGAPPQVRPDLTHAVGPKTKSIKTIELVETLVPFPKYAYETQRLFGGATLPPFPWPTATAIASASSPASTSARALEAAATSLGGGLFGVVAGVISLVMFL